MEIKIGLIRVFTSRTRCRVSRWYRLWNCRPKSNRGSGVPRKNLTLPVPTSWRSDEQPLTVLKRIERHSIREINRRQITNHEKRFTMYLFFIGQAHSFFSWIFNRILRVTFTSAVDDTSLRVRSIVYPIDFYLNVTMDSKVTLMRDFDLVFNLTATQ